MKIYFAGILESIEVYKDIREYFFKIPVKRVLASFTSIRELRLMERFRHNFHDCFLDCGAWTSYTKGKKINIDEYGRYVEQMGWMYSHICSLDEIYNAEISKVNWLYLKENYPQYEFLPIFHINESFSFLEFYISEKPSIILISAGDKQNPHIKGGGLNIVQSWLDTIFVKYPYRYHLLGMSHLPVLQRYPLLSCDSTTYLVGKRFGNVLLKDFRQINIGNASKGTNRKNLPQDIIDWLKREGINIYSPNFNFNQLVMLNLKTTFEAFEIRNGKETKPQIQYQQPLFV